MSASARGVRATRVRGVTYKLQDKVLLGLSHLVATPLLPAIENLRLSETKTSVGLELVLGDDAASAGGLICPALISFASWDWKCAGSAETQQWMRHC